VTAADKFLATLPRVMKTGDGLWRAVCPVHKSSGRSLTMSVRDVDGRLLVHCFAGCEVADILAAVGLQFADLYDAPLAHHFEPASGLKASERLALLEHESLVVLLILADMTKEPPAPETLDRLMVAVSRISRARFSSYG
jgi:hypothetical protein